MGGSLEFVRGRGWKLSASIVGAVALLVGIWVTIAFDSERLWPGLAAAIGFVAVVTILLVPRSRPGRRPEPPAPDGR